MAVSIGHTINCSQSSDVSASVKIKHRKRRLRATPIGKLLLGTPSTRIPPLLLSERRWIFSPATGNPCLPQVTVECTHSTTLAVTISFVSPIIIAARGVGGVFCVFLGHFSTTCFRRKHLVWRCWLSKQAIVIVVLPLLDISNSSASPLVFCTCSLVSVRATNFVANYEGGRREVGASA